MAGTKPGHDEAGVEVLACADGWAIAAPLNPVIAGRGRCAPVRISDASPPNCHGRPETGRPCNLGHAFGAGAVAYLASFVAAAQQIAVRKKRAKVVTMPALSRGAADALGDLGAVFALHHGDVVLALQIEPELRTIAEIAAEPHGRIGGNRTAAVQNVRDPARRHAEIDREPFLR